MTKTWMGAHSYLWDDPLSWIDGAPPSFGATKNVTLSPSKVGDQATINDGATLRLNHEYGNNPGAEQPLFFHHGWPIAADD